MAVSVRYWVSTDSPVGFPDLDGVEEFRNDLAGEYVALVRGRPSGAGGPVDLIVQIISRLPWSHVVQLLIDGVVYDLIKEGSKSFVLRPFISAYRKLRERNRNRSLDLAELQIDFEDCQLIIREVSGETIIDNLGSILRTLAEHYGRLRLPSGEAPGEIHVPVVEDPDPERPCRFRETARVDETITGKGADDYLAYWGVVYDHTWPSRVYDVRNGELMNERFNTVSEHWRELERRWEARRKKPTDK